MSKYSLINCYSDNNKGDLGIILSTIDYIKNNDTNAEIIGISTYNYSDPAYHSEHVLLKQEIDVYPSIFGELNINKNKSHWIKLIRFFWDSIRVLLFLIMPIRISSKTLFSKHEKNTLQELLNSDYIVSKGGSFICNNRDVRSKIALLRFLFIFILLFRLNKKVIILNQSIGPVYGNYSIKLVNHILQKCHKVVLRETLCIKKYPYLIFPSNTIIGNDIAFFLKSETLDLKFEPTKFNIGLTVKYVDKENEECYKRTIKESIEHIIKNNSNAHIYIFSQVPIDEDIEAAWEIYKIINDECKKNISFITGEYNCKTLKFLYSHMKIFIGTRLHSTIFAMGETVPSICISYHGTKAEGIFNNMKSSRFVVNNYNTYDLIEKYEYLKEHLEEQKEILKISLIEYRKMFSDSFKEIFDV